jgi:hypothetical protein
MNSCHVIILQPNDGIAGIGGIDGIAGMGGIEGIGGIGGIEVIGKVGPPVAPSKKAIALPPWSLKRP